MSCAIPNTRKEHRIWYSRGVLAIALGVSAHPRGSRHTSTSLGVANRVSQH